MANYVLLNACNINQMVKLKYDMVCIYIFLLQSHIAYIYSNVCVCVFDHQSTTIIVRRPWILEYYELTVGLRYFAMAPSTGIVINRYAPKHFGLQETRFPPSCGGWYYGHSEHYNYGFITTTTKTVGRFDSYL